MGTEGFSGASSLLYHRRSPSAIVRIEAVEPRTAVCWHRTSRCARITSAPAISPPAERSRDPVTGRQPLLGNDDVEIAWVDAPTRRSPLYRNATGDELVYVQSGDGGARERVRRARRRRRRLRRDPRVDDPPLGASTTAGRAATSSRRARSRPSPGALPQRDGPALEGAPFCERDLRGARCRAAARRRRGGRRCSCAPAPGSSVHVHATHPFDVVGWDGYLYPWALSIHDFEPIVGAHPPAAAGAPDVRRARTSSCARFVPRLVRLRSRTR